MFNYIDQRLREIKGVRHKLFGGTNIIMCGDLSQLPPVQDCWIFQCIGTAPNNSFENNNRDDDGQKETEGKIKDLRFYLKYNLWKDNVSMFELKEIMRTKNKEFAALQHRLRELRHVEGLKSKPKRRT